MKTIADWAASQHPEATEVSFEDLMGKLHLTQARPVRMMEYVGLKLIPLSEKGHLELRVSRLETVLFNQGQRMWENGRELMLATTSPGPNWTEVIDTKVVLEQYRFGLFWEMELNGRFALVPNDVAKKLFAEVESLYLPTEMWKGKTFRHLTIAWHREISGNVVTFRPYLVEKGVVPDGANVETALLDHFGFSSFSKTHTEDAVQMPVPEWVWADSNCGGYSLPSSEAKATAKAFVARLKEMGLLDE